MAFRQHCQGSYHGFFAVQNQLNAMSHPLLLLGEGAEEVKGRAAVSTTSLVKCHQLRQPLSLKGDSETTLRQDKIQRRVASFVEKPLKVVFSVKEEILFLRS